MSFLSPSDKERPKKTLCSSFHSSHFVIKDAGLTADRPPSRTNATLGLFAL